MAGTKTKKVIFEKPLYTLGIEEIQGFNLKTAGRSQVNKLLKSGWILLHIYTFRWHNGKVWCERPNCIVGRPKKKK